MHPRFPTTAFALFPPSGMPSATDLAQPVAASQIRPTLEGRVLDGNRAAIEKVSATPHIADLTGDQQMGTSRVGETEADSVLNRWCRLHEAQDVFVVDSSSRPTGFGLNPRVTVVANALRVGADIIDRLKQGQAPRRVRSTP